MSETLGEARSEAVQDVDVVVVGGGGGGLAAAVSVAEQGLSCVVLEKEHRFGGTTALSGGSVPGAGTELQRTAGVEDSPEAFAGDLMRPGVEGYDADIVRALAQASSGLVEWLMRDVGVRLRLIDFYKHEGHTRFRLHGPYSRSGADLIAGLYKAAERLGVYLVADSPAQELIPGEDGEVQGVIASTGGRRTAIRAKKIILALGGFGGAKALRDRWLGDMAQLPYFGGQGNTGDLFRWAEEIGLETATLDSCLGHSTMCYPDGRLLTFTAVEQGGVIVSTEGKRFGDESVGYSAFARKVWDQSGHEGIVVFDRSVLEYVARFEPPFKGLVDDGVVVQAENLGELAGRFELPLGSLEEIVGSAASRSRDPWGRTNWGIATWNPPFAAARVTAGVLTTLGGLKVDASGRVLRRGGQPLRTLFAVGASASGLCGAGSTGYTSGNGLLMALGLGRIAGQTAAREVARG